MKTTRNTTKRLLSMVLSLCMLLSAVPMVSLSASAAEYPTITPDTPVTFLLDETTTEAIYSFTPAESGVYRFYTYDGARDTYGYLLDAEGNVLAEDDDSANSGNNFLIAYAMTAGTTYLLKAQFYSVGAQGNISMLLEKAAAPTAVTINQGDTFSAYPVTSEQFLYTLEPDDAATVGATWTSSDPTVAEMGEDGYVRFFAPGTATLTVTTAEGLTADCEVTVLEPLPIKEGETVTANCELNYDVTYSFIPEKTATYAFIAESERYIPYAELRYTHVNSLMVLDYDEDQQDYEFRLQHELTAGEEYYLFVTGQLLDATFDVTVQEVVPATAMTLNHTTLEVALGGGMRLRPVYTPTNAIYEAITWESSDDTVVSVDTSGNVTFLKEGTATVTATTENGFTASCEITVGGYPTISLCKTETNIIGTGGSAATYLFTPEKDGNYAFYAASDYDTVGYIYDATGETLLYNNDDYGSERNFRVEAILEAGVTYRLQGQFYYNTQIGSIDLTMVRIDGNGDVIHDVSEYVITADSHSGVCDGCGKAVSDTHSYDENGLCVCGHLHIHTGTDYTYDETEHRYTCACGENVQQTHTFDADGNCMCGYFVHAHNEDTYDYDELGHWMVCSQCDVADGTWEEHTYDEYGECVCGDTLLYGVCIGDILIGNYEYLDTFGNITDEEPTGGYAYYEDGVLTLHDLEYQGATDCLVYAETELELVLEGDNRLHSLYGDGIYMSGADLTISGDGSLSIKADGDYDGIDVNGGKLKIEGVTLNIDATDHGIEVAGNLSVYDGTTIVIVAGDDGFDIDGNARFNGGVIDIDAEDNGIDSDYSVTINGGKFTIRTHDDNGIEASDDLTINDGEFEINANDECFYTVDGTITVNGGEFVLNAGSSDAVMMAGTDIVFGETMGEFTTTTDDDNHTVLVDENGDTAQNIVITSTDTVSLKAEWITLSQTMGADTGKLHTPTVTVVDDNGKTLVKDTDYTLLWSAESIKDSGVYTVTVTGIGAYSGTKLKTYTVYEDVVYVGDAILANGDYLDNNGDITTEAPSGGYAHYADGVLTLNNFTIEGVGYVFSETNVYSSVIFALNDLTIELIGDNTIVAEDKGITTYADLMIGGEGSLTVEGEFGISLYEGDVTINSGTLHITAAVDAIRSYGNVTVTGGELVLAAGDSGIYADDDVHISGGNITLLDAEEDAEDTYYGDGIIAENGDLTVSGGTIVIDTEYGLYTTYGSIYIFDGKITITGEYGICAENNVILIGGGLVTINADYGIYAYYGVYVEGGLSDIASTQYAVYADETIVLGDNVLMTLPENGNVDMVNGYYIVDEAGNIATDVILDALVAGDVNGDGESDTSDVRLTLQGIVGLDALSEQQMYVADMNEDGTINSADVRRMLMIAANV